MFDSRQPKLKATERYNNANKQISELKGEQIKTKNRMNIYEGRLLELEKSNPLMKVIANVRAEAIKTGDAFASPVTF